MTSGAESGGIVCACFNVTLDEMRRRKRTNPSLSFEGFMHDTGAGTKCTACLLDLEYHFVADASAAVSARALGRSIPPRRSLKRKIYDLVDALAPKRPSVSRTVAPVVAGKGLEEFLWIANQPLLYATDGVCAPAHVFDVRVTGGRGEVALAQRYALEPGEARRIDISAALGAGAGGSEPFAVGMLSVEARSKRQGVRGTTRPQIEILTPRSACAVHTQGATPRAGGGSFWAPCLPAENRIFMICMNPAPRPCVFTLRYPADIDRTAIEGHVRVEPRAAVCYEVDLERATALLPRGEIMRIAWTADGPHKIYFMCGTPSLDRFSVDHL